MNREEVLDFFSKNKQDLKIRFVVTKIGLFGSYARGEARNDSDIDIIVSIYGSHMTTWEPGYLASLLLKIRDQA